MGAISSLLRVAPAMKSRICLAVYFACWPASFGHSGLALLPAGPWQATQIAAFAAPRGRIRSERVDRDRRAQQDRGETLLQGRFLRMIP